MVAHVQRRKRKSRRTLPPGQKLLLLLAVAATACALTVAVFNPRPNSAQSSVSNPEIEARIAARRAAELASQMPFPLGARMTELEERIATMALLPNLKTGLFVVEPDTGRYLNLDANRSYSAASMIKLPILVRIFQAIDAGEIKPEQILLVRHDLKGGGSGFLQWRPDNTKISLKETMELMMVISDNTATNMLIDVLGGKEKFNGEFVKWGMRNTTINNWLPDLTGTNITSPYDLSLLLAKVDAGQLITPASRARMFEILEHNKHRMLLPAGIPPGTKIADKTGDIGKLVGDAGIITAKDGKRYIMVASVERPHNDRRANNLIRHLSKEVYIGITGDADGAKNLLIEKPRSKTTRHKRRSRRRH